jgi:hypothetical protein
MMIELLQHAGGTGEGARTVIAREYQADRARPEPLHGRASRRRRTRSRVHWPQRPARYPRHPYPLGGAIGRACSTGAVRHRTE